MPGDDQDHTMARPVALWVVPVADLAGVARHVLDVTSRGIPGWDVEVLAPEGPLCDRLRVAGVTVHVGQIGPRFGLVQSMRALRQTAAATCPRVVHSHLSYADFVVALTPGLGRIRRVTTEHGIARDDLVYHGTRWKSMLMAAAHRARLRRFDQAVAVSDATAQAMRDRWHPREGQVTVILNGVDRRDAPARLGQLRVASIARLAPEKRVDTLIDAFEVVRRSRPDASLTIAGEGPLQGQLEALVRTSGLDRSVVFLGHVDAAGVLAGTDVLVQLSIWENCSYSVLDAIVAGCGVVATDVGGNAEMLRSSSLVAPDAPMDEIADRILAQNADAQQRPSLPPGWPDVAEMCDALAELYRVVTS